MRKDERQRLESLLEWPAAPAFFEPGLRITAEAWNEAIALDAICRRAEAALRVRADYRQAEEHSVQVLWSQKFMVTGMRLRRWSMLRVGLGNPEKWASRVAARGMEIIGGRFVLALLSEMNDNADGQTEVLLAEQGRGMSVVPAIAKVVKKESGEWAIQGQPDKRHPNLEVLCSTVAKGKEPDDLVWKAAQVIRLHGEARRFEEFAAAPLAISAEGSSEVN
jgi:hypothetical protein